MFESFCELPERTIERSRDAHFFTPIGNCAVHKIHFGLALGKNVLEHAGFVFAGSVGAFLHERARIAVKLNAKSFCDGFSFGNERIEKRSSRRKARGRAVVKKGERAHGICRGVEDELGPLGAAGVLQGNHAQAGAVEKFGELLDARVRCVRWFEWADPGVAVDVETSVAWFDDVACRKCCATNDVADVLGENLFVADTILDGTDGAILAEDMRGLFDGAARVRALCGDYSEIARWNFARIGSRVEMRSEIGCAGDTQTALVNRARVFLPNVISVDFDVLRDELDARQKYCRWRRSLQCKS